ncbi:hypothetical protein [Paenibacillus illinoisensis]|uniref:hypothetical protein n=1 Tax=Paenibacillus illinoisensis TaxID=59845 RepID=UPI00301D45C5
MKIFNYTKQIIALIIILTLSIKFLVSDFKDVNFPDNLTDIISLTLALFSISLSAWFYFKANETSSQFYDNTYQFTKDISEKIGRIEERFGKDLTNIEQGYQRMLDKFDRLPSTEIQKEIEMKSSNEQEILKEKEEIIQNLIQKANLSEDEKYKISNELAMKERELDEVKIQLMNLNDQLIENKSVLQNAPHTRNIMYYVIKSLARNNKLPDTFSEFIDSIQEKISKLEDKELAILIQEGIVNSNKKITPNGKKIISRLFNEVS